MIFNGHTEQYIEGLDEELFAEIQVMYSDGLLGNKGIYEAIAPLTAAVFNYFRAANTPAFKPDQLFPWVHEYSTNPDEDIPEEEKASRGLIAFMSMAHGFKEATSCLTQ